MRTTHGKRFTSVIERDPDTGLYVGLVPGFSGAHTQGESPDEVNANLREVIEMLLEEPELAQKEELGHRWHAFEKNPDEGEPWEDVKKSLLDE